MSKFYSKKIINLFLSFLLLISLAPAQDFVKSKKIETIEGKKYYIHTVDKGQTLYAISKQYNISVNEIVIENPDAIDGLVPGKTIRIALDKGVKEIPKTDLDDADFLYYVVEPKQTLYSISKKYNVSIELINEINPNIKDGLKVGETIKLPKNNAQLKEEKILKSSVLSADDVLKKAAAVLKNDVNQEENNTVKEGYHIALFLPFNLDANSAIFLDTVLLSSNLVFPNKTRVSLEFYEGVKMAVDSLSKLNIEGKLYVYDIDEDTSIIETILAKKELRKMDLIIGPLSSANFIKVADFAKKNNIPIVSPLSQVNKVLLENEYASKVSASATTQLEKMASFIFSSYKDQNILVVNNTNLKELNYVNSFQKYMKEHMENQPKQDSIKEIVLNAKDYKEFEKKMSDTKINVVVVPLISSQAFVTDLISHLYSIKNKYKIVLFGMQNWADYDNLDIEYLNQLSLHLPSNYYFDESLPTASKFISEYRSVYKTQPSTFVLQGFDVTCFFLNGLLKHGKNLNSKLPEFEKKGLQTGFKFYQTSIGSGYENKFCYLLKYENYELKVVAK